MKVQIVTPEKTLFDGAAKYVQVCGSQGEFGVLPNHAPLVSSLKAGKVSVELAGGERQEFEVTGGTAEVQAEKVTILVD